MADVKISELPDAGALTGTEVVPIVQSGATKKAAADAVAATGLTKPTVRFGSDTEARLVGSKIYPAAPDSALNAGEWELSVGSSGANHSLNIRYNNAGTIERSYLPIGLSPGATFYTTVAIDEAWTEIDAALDLKADAAEVSAAFALKADKVCTLTAGNGLTGGGDLSADRTFNVGTGTGITVNADDVAIDTDVVPRKAVENTFTEKQRIQKNSHNGTTALLEVYNSNAASGVNAFANFSNTVDSDLLFRVSEAGAAAKFAQIGPSTNTELRLVGSDIKKNDKPIADVESGMWSQPFSNASAADFYWTKVGKLVTIWSQGPRRPPGTGTFGGPGDGTAGQMPASIRPKAEIIVPCVTNFQYDEDGSDPPGSWGKGSMIWYIYPDGLMLSYRWPDRYVAWPSNNLAFDSGLITATYMID